MIHSQPKWLAVLIILGAATLIVSGCPPAEQPPVNQPPLDEPPINQPPAEQPPVNEPPVNQPPVIDSLTSEWRQVKKAMAVPIECAARDPDGDELSYLWLVDGGDITGEGAVGNWVTPEDFGTYTITVTVTDGRGGTDVESIDIKVACCLIAADD